MRKNENKTYLALQVLFPQTEIRREVRIHEKIIVNGEIIRNYVIIDFFWKFNGLDFACEFDGSQHHRLVKKWGGKIAAIERLRKQRIRDKWLVKWCKSNSINLIVVDGRKIRGKKIFPFLKQSLKPFLKKP